MVGQVGGRQNEKGPNSKEKLIPKGHITQSEMFEN